MADKIPPRFRKTKSDKWAVMAPVEDLEKALAEGGKIDVQKRSGDWSTFTVGSLGKPFDVDGVQMCYGYAPDDGDDDSGDTESGGQAAAPSASSSGGGRRRSAEGSDSGRSRGSGNSRRPGSSSRSGRSSDHTPPPVDPTEPLPEYQGGAEDEWDGYF